MKVWVTKYWDTQGIYSVKAEKSKDGKYAHTESNGMLSLSQTFRLGKDAFEDRLDAVHRAGVLRDKKIKSLQKKIVELKSKRFE